MNTLSILLSSRARAEIFRLLFSELEEELHGREIQRRSGLNDSTIRQELRKLADLDLIRSRKDSNRIYYSANKENPLYQDIQNLVIKTSGLVDVLKGQLQDERIKIAFVFGSIPKGEINAGSDVDIMVIGEIGLRGLSGLLSGVSERIGREVNPYVLSRAEFRKRLKDKEHFLSSVLRSPKIFVIGNEHDLSAMGR
ncbi:MAG: nucleotidyltransferase domain-containing protein [Desulfobacteraceae bacterium]|nr:nucleotidyltransferase domain-containing protein [Desulfobacteraceae bacterium]